MGPTLGFDKKQRNSLLIKFGVFYNKNKILTILFIVNYEKITLLWWVFRVVGAHNQQVFASSNEEKNKPKQQRLHALVLSLWWGTWAASVNNFHWPQSCLPSLCAFCGHYGHIPSGWLDWAKFSYLGYFLKAQANIWEKILFVVDFLRL